MASNLVEEIKEKAAQLPLEKQREVLQMVESLAEDIEADKAATKRRANMLKGATADGTPSVTSEEIAEARRDMWRK